MELDAQQLPDMPSDCPSCNRPICPTCRSTWHSGLVSAAVRLRCAVPIVLDRRCKLHCMLHGVHVCADGGMEHAVLTCKLQCSTMCQLVTWVAAVWQGSK